MAAAPYATGIPCCNNDSSNENLILMKMLPSGLAMATENRKRKHGARKLSRAPRSLGFASLSLAFLTDEWIGGWMDGWGLILFM